MKTVFKTDEIAHIWAHKSAPFGKAPSALSFEGNVIRSYSTEMARHITHKGKAAIVFNENSYSITTTRHQGLILRAIPAGVPVFRIGGELRGVEGKPLFEYAVTQSAKALKKAQKARVNADWHKRDAAKWLESAREINSFFGLRRKVDENTIERLKSETEAAERKHESERKAREAKMMADQRGAFEAWKRGEEHEYFNIRLFPVAFRIEGEELVSTMGARVPLREARVAHAFAMARRESGWHRNGTTCPVGHYQLDSVTPAGVVAGCHRISWAEMKRVASLLNA